MPIADWPGAPLNGRGDRLRPLVPFHPQSALYPLSFSMTYEQALAYWFAQVNYEQRAPVAGDLKLDRMRTLLARLGSAEPSVSAPADDRMSSVTGGPCLKESNTHVS